MVIKGKYYCDMCGVEAQSHGINCHVKDVKIKKLVKELKKKLGVQILDFEIKRGITKDTDEFREGFKVAMNITDELIDKVFGAEE